MEAEKNKGLEAPQQATASGATAKTSRIAKAAFILGLTGIVILILSLIAPALVSPLTLPDALEFIAIVGVALLAGLALSLSAVILGIIAWIMIRKGKGMLKGQGWAISGLVMGLVPLVLCAAFMIYGFYNSITK